MTVRGPLGAGLILALAMAGCTLEPRSGPESDEEVPATEVADSVAPGADPIEAARTTVEVFREAVRVGDLSLALSLLAPDAVLVDELAAEGETGSTRGELLMAVRRRHSDGMTLEPVEQDTRAVGDAYLVTSRWTLRTTGDDVPRTVHETALVLPSPNGWRIAHYHRSEDPAP